MGMDLIVIMEHSLDMDEIVQLPETILTWSDIHQKYALYNKNPTIEIGAKWNCEDISKLKQLLQQEWEQWEQEQDITLFCTINTTMFELTINRRTVQLCLWAHHKYSNLYDFSTRKYIIELMRLIGKKFDSPSILYCPDDYCSTAILKEKSSMGLSLEETIEYGIQTFGPIPKTLTKAIYNHFFVDNYMLDLEDYPKDTNLFNRSNEEYFLEQKFGERYIIKRRP